MKNSNIVIFTKLLEDELGTGTKGIKNFIDTLDKFLSLDKKLLIIVLSDSQVLRHSKESILDGFLYHYRYLSAIEKIAMLTKLRYDLDQEIKRREGIKGFRVISAKKLSNQEKDEVLELIKKIVPNPEVSWHEDSNLVFGFIIENEETKIDCSFIGLKKNLKKFVYKQVMKND